MISQQCSEEGPLTDAATNRAQFVYLSSEIPHSSDNTCNLVSLARAWSESMIQNMKMSASGLPSHPISTYNNMWAIDY